MRLAYTLLRKVDVGEVILAVVLEHFLSDFFRVKLGIVSRSDGHSAAKRSAYQSCGRVTDAENRTFDFRRKAKEHVCTLVLAPENAPTWVNDPQELWLRAASMEKRVDAQEARIIDFSLPREVPKPLREACIRYVYGPFIEKGMVLQVDVHDTKASDGGRNVNVHGLATLRTIDGEHFSKAKDRTWNELFRKGGGRVVRELFAQRLRDFCASHGIHYQGDARSNLERGLPAPEAQLPKWNFEVLGRTGHQTQALQELGEHRRRRRQWQRAWDEEARAGEELEQIRQRLKRDSQRRISPAQSSTCPDAKDSRAAVLRVWHQSDWVAAGELISIASVRYDSKRGFLWIDLKDGTTLVDRGDAITMQGKVTWQAAEETAAAARRHGWQQVELQGDKAYKDAVAAACFLEGIAVTNHVLSQEMMMRLEALKTERSKDSNESDVLRMAPMGSPVSAVDAGQQVQSSRDVYARSQSRNRPVTPAERSIDDPTPAYKPRLR